MSWRFDPINYTESDQIRVKIWLIDNPSFMEMISFQSPLNVLKVLGYVWNLKNVVEKKGKGKGKGKIKIKINGNGKTILMNISLS